LSAGWEDLNLWLLRLSLLLTRRGDSLKAGHLLRHPMLLRVRLKRFAREGLVEGVAWSMSVSAATSCEQSQ
jgi:hypothetical protein